EDGIRDFHVTGVQTCALPIFTIPLGVVVALSVGSLAGQLGAEGYGGAVVAFVIVGQAAPLICALMISGVGGSAMCADLGARKIRSEERRVGKECRARWSRLHK